MKLSYLKSLLLFLYLTLILFQIHAKPPIPLYTNKYSQKVSQPEEAVKLSKVVVSSMNNNNLITWYKQPKVAIKYFNIYRKYIYETNSDWYCVGKVSYNNDPYFIDAETKYLSNKSFEYRVSCVDPCENEIFSDSIVQPINLQIESINGGANTKLLWNSYKGINVKKYYILSGLFEDSLEVIDSISSDSNMYLDKRGAGVKFYQIIAIGNLKNDITNFTEDVIVFSNFISLDSSLTRNEIEYNKIVIINENFLVLFRKYCGNRYKARIFDLCGRLIFEQTYNAETFEINHSLFHKGIYILQIEDIGNKYSVKFKI